MSVIDKINSTLQKLGVDLVLAKASETMSGETATTGETSGATVTSAAAGVVVSEIIPKTIKISYSAIGAPVIQTNEDGKEENVTDGEYILTTNKKITIQDGKLVSEIDVEEIENEEEKEDAVSGETKMEIETPVEPVATSELEMANLESQRLREIIDVTKDGSYTIEISVSNGEIVWGTLYTNTYQNLMLEKEEEIEKKIDELTLAYEEKLSANEKIIEALKIGEVKPNITPVASDVKLSKSDFIKLDIQEKINKKKI